MKRVAVLAPATSHHFVPELVKVIRARHECEELLYASIDDAIALLRRAEEQWKADAVVIEWANSAAPMIVNQAQIPVVQRLHRYEVWEPHVQFLDWSKVALLLVGSTEIRDLAIAANLDIARVPTHVQPAPIDLEPWPLEEPVGRNGHRIGVVANFDSRKNPFAYVELMRRLPRDYTLHIVGSFPEEWLRVWWKHASAPFAWRVELVGPLPREKLRAFWADKSFCFAPGLHETAGPMAAVEAAACGVMPLVYDYPAASEFWPESVLWDTVSYAAALVDAGPMHHNLARKLAWKHSVQARGDELLTAIEKALGW